MTDTYVPDYQKLDYCIYVCRSAQHSAVREKLTRPALTQSMPRSLQIGLTGKEAFHTLKTSGNDTTGTSEL